MTSPNATFTQMVTSTLRSHPKDLADNVSKHNALYAKLRARGRIKVLDGGYEIVRPLDYAENATFQRYSGYEALAVGASDVITGAKYDWKQAAVHVSASGLELRNNSGRARLIDLAKAKLTNAMRTMANNLSVDIYSLGTADGGKQIGGLQQMITQDGTGTIGGIVSGTYTFWKNKYKDLNSADKTNIGNRMNLLWLDLVRGTDKPDMIVSSNELYALYWDGLTDNQRWTSANNDANMGFQSIKFQTCDIFHDGGSGIPANTMYFLNTDYLELCVHADANLTVSDEKISTNQDATTIPILFQGNLACSNRSLQGVAFD